MEPKKYCEIHHFYYRSQTCPLCDKERIDKLAKSYTKENKKEKNEVREANEDDIRRLMEKFNAR